MNIDRNMDNGYLIIIKCRHPPQVLVILTVIHVKIQFFFHFYKMYVSYYVWSVRNTDEVNECKNRVGLTRAELKIESYIMGGRLF